MPGLRWRRNAGAPGEKIFGQTARPMAVLCLPELLRYPQPEEEVQCRAKLLTAVEVSHVTLGRGCRAETSVSRSRRGVNAGSNRASLEDFLESPRRSGRPGRVRAVRPTQRQPIDDNTSVPAEAESKLLRMRVTALKYLEHSDAALLRQVRAAEARRTCDLCLAAILFLCHRGHGKSMVHFGVLCSCGGTSSGHLKLPSGHLRTADSRDREENSK
eukprot:Skav212136  [mRNA]  locus=scaffold1323:235218:240927:- [translate_table: standard]